MAILKRTDRLIAGSVISAVLIVWLVLVGFDALNQLVRQLNHVGQHGYTVSDALAFIALTLPRRMYQHFGSAALIGGLLGLGGLAASGELTALRAAGMSKFRIVSSVVVFVGALTVVVMLMGETVAPAGDQQANALQLRTKDGRLDLSDGGGLWARDGDTVINARNALSVQHQGHRSVRLSDVRIYTIDNNGALSRFVHAQDATHDRSEWTLHDVRITDLDDDGVHASQVASLPWHTMLNSRVLEQSVVHPEYLSMPDLMRNMHYLESNGLNPGAYANAFWEHALFPLNVLSLVLCAMPFAFGSLRSGGLGRRIFIGIILAIGWYFLRRVITNMGMVYGVSALLANLVPALLLIVLAGTYFKRQS
ncbi:LPS export ABC transporter permease LptG [Oleiagrimonas sp.]|jgi:lipopolysaccharide export system permease protein|uniref:LPS export ABC transporter permease LptG n=1 Tax=Oleiagrimonas sp. TaxID=2010330 RepID=UPI002635CBA8|nr:LPS export ABC transporter permease LptG [Oleiagrimonas sp.]MDA3913691.1 LPS export ABC transporter permease LptG [Oleiagrimonas sp.]